MIAYFEKVENPTFVMLQNADEKHNLSTVEIDWLLRNRNWHLSENGEKVQTPYFTAHIARIDRINGFANKVFLEAI